MESGPDAEAVAASRSEAAARARAAAEEEGRRAAAGAQREEAFERHKAAAAAVARANRYLARLPFLHPYMDLEKGAAVIAAKNPGSFNWAISFEPDFVAELMRYGFLPMCDKAGRSHVLLPKLHTQRCLLEIADLHISRSTRKRAKTFEVSMDQAFGEVCKGIVAQHGASWFYPPIVAAFAEMNARGASGCGPHHDVHVHSFEAWIGNELVAGEVGYLVGTCYTALSGFSRVDGSGSVQMAATGSFLAANGVTLWDFGMHLPYKTKLGARSVPRRVFLERLARCRQPGSRLAYLRLPRTRASDLIEPFVKAQRERHAREEVQAQKLQQTQQQQQAQSAAASAGRGDEPLSKTQAKKRARLERRRQLRAAHRAQAGSTANENDGQAGAYTTAEAAASTPPDATSLRGGHDSPESTAATAAAKAAEAAQASS